MIKIWCDYCRSEQDLDVDMGSWCANCGAEVDDTSIIYALMRAMETLQKEVDELKKEKKND